MSYSQYGQDTAVDLILSRKRDGVFVDIGAHNGIALSNTYFFETERNWTGVCFEPNPKVFHDLVKNRKCNCENKGVSTSNGILKFWKITGYCEMLSGFVDFYDKEHIKRIEKELIGYGGSKEVIDVNVINLNDYLLEKDITYIDYMSIDTEGGEFDILKTIDFSKIDIKIVGVENNYNDQEIKKFMAVKGFSMIKRIECDEIYIK